MQSGDDNFLSMLEFIGDGVNIRELQYSGYDTTKDMGVWVIGVGCRKDRSNVTST
jgi:hypothetical protein